MIVYAALVPNSPLLIETINKERLGEVKKTTSAIETIRDHLYAAKPDAVVFLSAQTHVHEESFGILFKDSFSIDLSEFGDLAERDSYKPNPKLSDRIQRYMRREEIPVTLDSDNIDYSSGVPMILFGEAIKGVSIVPISHSGFDGKQHFLFGKSLQDVLHDSDLRIAVIGCGNLSHALSTDAPAGFAKEGAQFDEMIQSHIEQKNAAGLLQVKSKILKRAHETAYLPILMTLGVLDGVKYDPHILSYEHPFGVGFLTVEFTL